MEKANKPFSLNIIDFLGIFIPGIFFFSHLIILVYLFFDRSIIVFDNPLKILSEFIKNLNVNDDFLIGLIIFLLFGFIIGYILKPFIMDLSDSIAVLFSKKVKTKNEYEWPEDYKSPYMAIFKEEEYFENVTNFVEKMTQVKFDELPGRSPYSFCKRLVKIIVPELWEESEHIEAEVRMIGSFFIISILSFLIAIIAFVFSTISLLVFAKWVIIALFLMIATGRGFRKRRIREVEYVYLYILAAKIKLEMKCIK